MEFYLHCGELVFLGGTFEEGSDDGANITLKFEVQRNAEISIGERDGTNTTWRSKIYKRGWDFGWIRTVTVNGQGVQVEVPDSIHVDQIADYVDFGQLGIFDVLIAEEEARDEEEEE